MSRCMTLQQLADGLFDISGCAEILVSGLTSDSRAIANGDAFVAVPGLTAHGLHYLTAAQAASASVVLFEPPAPEHVDLPANVVAVADLKHKQAAIANRFFGSPSKALSMVGVTGTNGKTSTVQLIAQAFTLMGRVAGSIGTLGTGLYGNLLSGERTTPDVIAVHKALADMRDQGAEVVAMEVSSHALDQERVAGVTFDTAVFSNLTLDHLDYHGSMQAYFEAKAKLFSWPGLRCAVINIDDIYGQQLLQNLPSQLSVYTTSSQGNRFATLSADQIDLSLTGMRFSLRFRKESILVQSPLLGRFNADNLLATAGVLLAQGFGLAQVAALLSKLTSVGGRMSRIGGIAGKPLVVVDYAHTPDALEQALKTLRGHSQAKLICVFGCGGDRDRSKRPQMAAIAEQLADAVWVTDDNPRSESNQAIVAEICTGFSNLQNVHIQHDRRLAIQQALQSANAEDIVLIAGKGHETYQEANGIKTPFDDRAIAAEFLAEAA